MKAMIFAAGLGTRLRPFTLEHPKALVEIDGEPVLGHVIKKLISGGLTHAIVNVHHFPDQIRDYLKRNNNFGIDIEISDETEKLLDTGGALVKAERLIDFNEPLVIHNADILTNFSIEKMYDDHMANKADATLLTATRKTSRYLCFNNANRLNGWVNISTGETLPSGYAPSANNDNLLAFGGIHIINPATVIPKLKSFSDSDKFSIIPFYASNAPLLEIRSYSPTERYFWHDIGKPESLEAARREFSLQK